MAKIAPKHDKKPLFKRLLVPILIGAFLGLLLIILTLYFTRGRVEYERAGSESPVNDSAKLDTSAAVARDTTERGPLEAGSLPVVPEPKTGVLGYSYFKEMKRKETRLIHAFISINNPENNVRSTLRALNIDDQMQSGNDTSSVFTRNMMFYQYVTVTLINASDSAFLIKPIHESARQFIDSVNGNHWEWSVTPITDEGRGVLLLKVVAEPPAGQPEGFQSPAIPIKIDIQVDIIRRVWNWMIDNPGKVLTLILIPVVAYFGRKLFGKRDNKGKDDKGDKEKDDKKAVS